MPLQLKCIAASRLPIDFAGIIPERIRGRSLAEIERSEILCGNRRLPLAELFSVADDPAAGEIHLTGDHLSSVHGVGTGMTQGAIRIEGHAGRNLGAQMRGGRIDVFGSAGDWAGAEMHGGTIHVRGNVADHAAGAYPGSLRGMTGGELLVEGSAGDSLGAAMRRGLVAVAGSAGVGVGSRMIAGTIIVGSQCGGQAGAGMRRGTIVLMRAESSDTVQLDTVQLDTVQFDTVQLDTVQLLPTFVRANQWNPPFLRLLLAYLQRAGFANAERWIDADYIVYHGDPLALNKGEILVRV